MRSRSRLKSLEQSLASYSGCLGWRYRPWGIAVVRGKTLTDGTKVLDGPEPAPVCPACGRGCQQILRLIEPYKEAQPLERRVAALERSRNKELANV
jgi:hypothetical protein